MVVVKEDMQRVGVTEEDGLWKENVVFFLISITHKVYVFFDLTHYTNNLKNNVPFTLAAVCCTFIYSLSLCPSSLSARNEIIRVVSAENNQTHVCIHFSKRV